MNDLISRGDALNFEMSLEAKNEQEAIGVVRGMQIYADHIKSLPGVGWISVEERLPENIGDYLTYGKIEFTPDHIGERNYYLGIKVRHYYDGAIEWRRLVKYWMPLPEPPKEE